VGEEFPLECPACGGDIRLIAFITEPGPIRKMITHFGEPLEPPPVSPARGPPTDWGELVQAHDDREAVQASPQELPAIDIHSLGPLPPARSRQSRRAAGLGEPPRTSQKTATSEGEVRRTGQGFVRAGTQEHATREPLIRRAMLAEVPLAGLPMTEEVLAYPTPIGRTVNGEEIHFRLAEGRIAYVPLEELFELAKAHTRRKDDSLSNLAARVVTVGPARDFNLDYVVETKIDRARGQVLVRSREWVVRPVGPAVGEPVAEALGPTSRFRGVLSGVKPDTTVTLWCYPDSFEGYRVIRAELHRLGVPTAGRPLPDGAPIGGSTDGSKSVVQ
jgi:hypothetical protein